MQFKDLDTVLRVSESLSRVCLLATQWTVAEQAPLSMGFSRQEYWGGLPFPSPGDLPGPGMEPGSPASQAVSLLSEPSWWVQTSWAILSGLGHNHLISLV